ncbi:ABC transporter ATP-binding protein [Pelagibacterium luteolum]|uniref:Peptide/nickel transport system ATP-binding protein n=1 Tax=Pelagibacterium luteolum TaxID=440168 RepID=A0A1G7XXV5_9HYPH|nr:ABC transporter ATP-binding protein [Pelagibacterium luteolum]SDG89025.1 peptide/nickel transport system ATP-binding protein [Pelagibacterium luteolum]
MGEWILQVKNLHTYFRGATVVKAVRGIDLEIAAGETLGIVGESGSGKSVMAQAMMRLVQSPGGIEKGEILLDGEDLAKLPEARMRAIRGNKIAMIFQEPMTSLNPVIRVGDQIAEVVRLHRGYSKRQALDFAIEMLRKVRIADPERRAREYPHELSGGMRQRVMIAMGLACNPKLIVADEPTTALDVTIQAQILKLMVDMQAETGTAMLLITHDLGVVAETAQRVAVMYAGQVVEYAGVEELFADPLHPYTQGLMASVPQIDQPRPESRMLPAIPGAVPSLDALPVGCAFQDRCPHVFDKCRVSEPLLKLHRDGHSARCWLHD